jgi:hypothetical protein
VRAYKRRAWQRPAPSRNRMRERRSRHPFLMLEIDDRYATRR